MVVGIGNPSVVVGVAACLKLSEGIFECQRSVARGIVDRCQRAECTVHQIGVVQLDSQRLGELQVGGGVFETSVAVSCQPTVAQCQTFARFVIADVPVGDAGRDCRVRRNGSIELI